MCAVVCKTRGGLRPKDGQQAHYDKVHYQLGYRI